MIVMKFGGSSLESAAAIERVASIVKQRVGRRPVVVVSAMGKTTDRLLALARHVLASEVEESMQALDSLRRFHETETDLITLAEDRAERDRILRTVFDDLRSALAEVGRQREFTPELIDLVSSVGERLSSALIALAFRFFGMDAAHADSREVLVTDTRHAQAMPLYPRTNARIREKVLPLVEQGKVVVMGGFIGSTQDGVTTTLGRGGSDFTASIIGAGLDADEIQIWTDVDGMLTCDPRIAPIGRRVKSISFREAAELAYFGAKVLHPLTVVPAIEKSIPVMILNSRRPDATGTKIAPDAVRSTNMVKSIACKRGITVVNIQSMRMLMAYGFLSRLFEVFERYRVPVDMLATSEVSVSLTIDNTEHLDEIKEELGRVAEVTVEQDQAIICVVGENLRYRSGVAARIFSALKDCNIRMISQGASAVNVSFVVAGGDVERAVRALHQEFFSEIDPEVFD